MAKKHSANNTLEKIIWDIKKEKTIKNNRNKTGVLRAVANKSMAAIEAAKRLILFKPISWNWLYWRRYPALKPKTENVENTS